jgi:hypothetical protein
MYFGKMEVAQKGKNVKLALWRWGVRVEGGRSRLAVVSSRWL